MRGFALGLLCLCGFSSVVSAGIFDRIRERRENRKNPETVTVKEETPVVVKTEKVYRLSGQKVTVTPAKGKAGDCPNCK